MGLFSSILSKIGLGGHPAAAPAAAAPAAKPSSPPAPAAASPAATAPAAAPKPVDVVALLTDKAAHHDEKGLDWKHSIVDLLKLLDLDSSLHARQGLAKELGYKGDTSKSADMNVWLIKEVMTRLVANGGNIPKELTH